LRHFSTCSTFLAPNIAVDVCGNFKTQAIARDVRLQPNYFYAISLSSFNFGLVFYLSKPWVNIFYANYFEQTPVFSWANLPTTYWLSRYFPVRIPPNKGLKAAKPKW